MMGLLSHRKAGTSTAEEEQQRSSPFVGTLTDMDIWDYVRKKQLISANFIPERVKQSCYELRASKIYYYPIESNTRREVTPQEGAILLRPNQVVVIITEESLKIPNDILGRVLTKGSLFSLGINAVNTYVDPGFSGKLGIVFQNRTTKYLKIPVGEPIAKVEFSKLHTPVEQAYHGQHGYETEIWPIRSELFVDTKELKDRFKISDPMDEIGLLYGDTILKAYQAALKLNRRLTVAILIFVFLTALGTGLALYFGGTADNPFTWLINIAIGTASSIVATLLVNYFDKK